MNQGTEVDGTPNEASGLASSPTESPPAGPTPGVAPDFFLAGIWVALALLAPIAIVLVVQEHFRTTVFRGSLVFGKRWDAWRPVLETETGALAVSAGLLGLNVVTLAGSAFRRRQAWPFIGLANFFLMLMLAPSILLTLFGRSGPDWLAHGIAMTGSWHCVCLGGYLAGLYCACRPPLVNRARSGAIFCLLASTTFVIVFAGLAILQYQALHVPHGDTGMYEEHLWNLLHGKGFRSQLDDGRLFLGEHLQLIHVFLIPIYALAPSLPTLNVLQALALASVAWVVRRMGLDQGLSGKTATTFAFAVLLYFPLQYLGLESTWKTFRPTSFGPPILALALWALEARRFRLMAGLLALLLLVQEEYAIVLFSLGTWLALVGPNTPPEERKPWRRFFAGVGLAGLAGAAFVVIMTIVIPYFRAGADPHYTPYYKSLGDSPREIVWHVLTHPAAIAQKLANPRNVQFFGLMLAPIAFLSLLSPSRFLVAAPVFGYLMLADRPELAQPWFHFHAPLVALLLWSGVVGLARFRPKWPENTIDFSLILARLAVGSALVTGFWFGRGPLSLAFHDPLQRVPREKSAGGSLFKPEGAYWRDLYLPNERTHAFSAALALVQPTDRVAATDYIRSRFTHHQRCFDYPNLRRHVTIDDVDVLVLDKTEGWWGRGPTNPDQELLLALANEGNVDSDVVVRGQPFTVVRNDKYFLVVRRRATEAPAGNATNTSAIETSGALRHAKLFSVQNRDGYRVLEVSNPWRSAKVRFQWTLVPRGAPAPSNVDPKTIVRTPVQSLACLSTTFLPSIEALAAVEQLSAVARIEHIYSPAVRAQFQKGALREVGESNRLNFELVLQAKPEVLVTYGIEDGDESRYKTLQAAGTTVLFAADYMEPSPLGRAEWIKFFGVLLGKEEQANARFAEMERRYHELASLAAKQARKPTALVGIPFQGTWYVPGGKNNMAQLLRDAGANYPWSADTSAGSIPLDLESVFAQAGESDFWINANWKTEKQALASDNRFSKFKAFQTGQTYHNNRRVNPTGASDFWEAGLANPDQLLADLVAIFHPELLPNHPFTWYGRLTSD